MACKLIDLALVAFNLLMFKVGGIIGISKIEFFKVLKGKQKLWFIHSLVSVVQVIFYHKVNPADNYKLTIETLGQGVKYVQSIQ